MTLTLESLDQRLTVVEERMDQDAGLRASQDRDLSEMAATLKTQKDLLQALATTQSEHTRKLDHLDREVGELRGGMGRLETGMQLIVGKLDVLIAREDER